jgi:NADH dehydrogenase
MTNKVQGTRVVIVGAGFAGLRAAHRLGKAGAQVTLIDRNNYHLFQPLLYQVATTGLNPSEISSTVRGNFSGRKNVRVIKAELSGVDRVAKKAFCDQGELEFPYDYLILCAGGKTGYFGNDHWSTVAPGLKTLDDAAAIRNRFLDNFERAELTTDPEEIKRLTSVVIIGGGPTGVELAGSFAELRGQVLNKDFRGFDPAKSSVTLLEGGPCLLVGYDAKLSAYTKKRLEKVGVEVFLETRVTDITSAGVVTSDLTFASANVIWAAGVEGLPLAKELVTEVTPRNGIVVKPDLTVPDDEYVYACGDMAYYAHDPRYPRGLPGVAQVAMQQGDLAAKNILAHLAGKERKTFSYFDKGKMATIGRSAAVAEAKGLKLKGFIAWCAWLFIHVIYLVEFQDRVLVFLRWVWSYVTWHWGVRIIFEAKPLKGTIEPLAPKVESAELKTNLERPDPQSDPEPETATEPGPSDRPVSATEPSEPSSP